MNTIPAPLKGKVAVVTGGSRGIGAGIAQKFAEEGCTHIAITYNTNKDKAQQVLASLREVSPNIKTCAIAADVLDPEFGSKVVKQALAALETDHIDIMVSNAAYIDVKSYIPVADLNKEDWDLSISGLAWAPLSLAKEVIHHMPHGGRIIMLSSGSSKVAQGDPLISYAAGKAAMDAVSRNLAAAWGLKYGVTVNSISVGATYTDAIMEGIKLWGPEFEKMAKEFSLIKRFGTVEEIASIVAFVASPQASWLIGEWRCSLFFTVESIDIRNRQSDSSERWRSFYAAELSFNVRNSSHSAQSTSDYLEKSD